MSATQTQSLAAPAQNNSPEKLLHDYGERLFQLIESAEPPSVFSRKGFYGAMMDWAMRDERFKTQLFRFVDVLPSLSSASDIARHLQEYLGEDQVKLSPALRMGLAASTGASWLVGSGVRNQVGAMARQFMLGAAPKEIAGTLRELHDRGTAFTVDILGETAVSEPEAEDYARRYLDLMENLASELQTWPAPCLGNAHPRGALPALNVSVKISALYSQIHPADPETAIRQISERLRPILLRAKQLRAFVNLDMEHYGLKELTLSLFKRVLAEPQFQDGPDCGLAMQAYLRDCEKDLRGLLQWCREHDRRITVRLVKGAYWDFESIISQQRDWPCPVFARKAETDANYEQLSRLLLENCDVVDPAFGTHNVRSIARVLAEAELLGVDPKAFEFQMLYGMAEPIKEAVLRLGCRLREYCPVGDLLPGIAYFVRRLLENTSNEGFLAQRFGKGFGREELLKDPKLEVQSAIPDKKPEPVPRGFQNEPATDFTRAESRQSISAALAAARKTLGKKFPLVIGNKPFSSNEWLPSLNPADQRQVIGLAAQATLEQAEAAVTVACQAANVWAGTPVPERCALLERVAAAMRRRKAEFCALEILEAGKNWSEADADVAEAIDFCNYYAQVMRGLGRTQVTQFTRGESNYQEWRPRGVGVIIAPWNFPLAILTGMTAAAVVAGNTVIVKPSDQTPVIGARLVELFISEGAPPGVVNLLTGSGSTVGAHLVAHPQIDLIAFTGSKEVGLKIWETAARTGPGQANLKKVVCEMGGKNCIIVDADADLDEAVTGCIHSAFGYQGQKCSALSRLIVCEANYERFVSRLIAAAASLRVGPAEEPGAMLGPVINREAQRRILQAIENGRTEANLLWQGRVPDDPNACYVPPTIFDSVGARSRLFREEIFAPVLAISRAADFEAALELANDSEFALTGGCYSRSPKHVQLTKERLVCGNLYINRPITGAIVERQPFGGFKMSGGGTKAGGAEYLENFLVPRVVTENCLRRGFAAEPD